MALRVKLEMNSNFSYKKAGVDLDKSDLIKDKLVNNVSSTHNKNVINITNNDEQFGDLKNTDYVHLHNHTQFSMLQSTIKIDNLVDKAHEYDMKAVAITDLGNMMGAFRFVDYVKR